MIKKIFLWGFTSGKHEHLCKNNNGIIIVFNFIIKQYSSHPIVISKVYEI